jgi:hypothetical protein
MISWAEDTSDVDNHEKKIPEISTKSTRCD